MTEWVPVSERLPEEDYQLSEEGYQLSGVVLITVCDIDEPEHKVIDFGQTKNGVWFSKTTEMTIPWGWRVTAWLPLPTPWKGE